MRIVFAGFEHETNTFAPSKADWKAFELGGGWPGMVSGQAIFEAVRGANIPAAGFIKAAQQHGHTLIPTTWCAASPSAHVTRDAYNRISALILAQIARALPVDAVYLDLHGAMVSENHDDGEGELIAQVRKLVGKKIPIVASLDLHANMTLRMLREADALIAFRTYPHVDMADTGKRAFDYLQKNYSTDSRLNIWPSGGCLFLFRFVGKAPLSNRPRRSIKTLGTLNLRWAWRAYRFAWGFQRQTFRNAWA